MDIHSKEQIMLRIKENLEAEGILGEPLDDQDVENLIKTAAKELMVTIDTFDIENMFDDVIGVNDSAVVVDIAYDVGNSLLGSDSLLDGLDWAEGLLD